MKQTVTARRFPSEPVEFERRLTLPWRRVAGLYCAFMATLAVVVIGVEGDAARAAWWLVVIVPAPVVAWGLRYHRPAASRAWNALVLGMSAFAVHAGITELLLHVVDGPVVRVLQIASAALAVACGALAIGEVTLRKAHMVEFGGLLSAALVVEWLVVCRPDPQMALAPSPLRAALIALPVLLGLAALFGLSRKSVSVSAMEFGLLAWATGFSTELMRHGRAGDGTRVGELIAFTLIGVAALSPAMAGGFGAEHVPHPIRFGYVGALLLAFNPFVAEMAYVGYQRRWLVVLGITSGAVGTALFTITALGWAPLPRRRALPVTALRSSPLHSGAAWISNQLQTHIDLTSLEVHYQPVVRCHDGAIAGAEALVRARRPDGSVMLATEVLELARLDGHLDDLDRFVLDRVVTDLPFLVSIAEVDEPYVSVNLSPSRLESAEWVEHVLAAASRTAHAASALVIEVTEHEPVRDWDRFSRSVTRLQEAGVMVAMDDFGIGASNLTSLGRFDADVLKLDRGLVLGIGRDPRADTIAKSAIRMAQDLGIRVVAEGIEDRSMLTRLARMGVDYAQGFAIGEPGRLDQAVWFRPPKAS